MLLKCRGQLCGNAKSVTGFNLPAGHEIYEFAVTQYADRRRGWRMGSEVVASFFCGITILTGKDSDGLVWFCGSLLQCHANRRTHPPCSASADRIDDDHRSS